MSALTFIDGAELREGDTVYCAGTGWRKVTSVEAGTLEVRVGSMSMLQDGASIETVPETRPCIVFTTDDGREYRTELDRRVEVRR